MSSQDGVVSRRQVLRLGEDDVAIERRLRRREWARLHRGVYVDHTGEPTWNQRCWGAVLVHAPAALCGPSAVQLWTGAAGPGPSPTAGRPPGEDVVHVAVDHRRRVDPVPGVACVRVRELAEHVAPNRRPARVRLEHALLHAAASSPSDAAALALLAHACQRGHTTAERLVRELGRHSRLPRRAFLGPVLEDVAVGAYSVLEQRYLARVERPHRLPTAARQRVSRGGRTSAYRDVEYVGVGLVVELDGRLGHESARDRWGDAERDLVSLMGGALTVRLTWGQVLDPCRTAAYVARLLRLRGWTGQPVACGARCPAGPAPG